MMVLIISPVVDVSWTNSVGLGWGVEAGRDSAWGSKGRLRNTGAGSKGEVLRQMEKWGGTGRVRE